MKLAKITTMKSKAIAVAIAGFFSFILITTIVAPVV